MNKLTKVGLTALCGSLAGISSANAGELSISGGADLTYVSLSDAVTGAPIGMGSNYSLKGSGELDNGWTVDLTIANANGNAFSAAIINLGMGGLGSLNFNQGNSGNGLAAIDDKMPTAWEETWGAGLTSGVRLAVGSGASQNIQYTTPTVLGTTLKVTYAHQYGATDIADKGSASNNTQNNSSYDATININPSLGTEILSGLNVFAGAATIERQDEGASLQDAYEGVAGVTYDIGPLSLGVQWSGDYTGANSIEGQGNDINDYNFYKNHAFGVAFNVNDDLSVSYGEWVARKAGYTDSATVQGGEDTKTVEINSFQIAYTMGGASFRYASTEVENQSWSAGTDRDATTLSLGLAF